MMKPESRNMSSESAALSRKPRRIPRKGIVFAIARVGGRLLIALGMLLLGIAVIGFFVVLVQIGPTFIGSIRHLEQQMGRFIFLISLVYLLIFPVVGLLGTVMTGVGLVLGYIGTGPAVSSSTPAPGQAQNSQPPTNHAD